MSPCYWCTPDGALANLLQSYASTSLPPNELAAANDDLCYCLECVDEYHKARDGLPSLHELLWEMETTRLVTHFEKSMDAEDDLYIVEEDRETPLFCYTGPEFEKCLRVPLLEILKYPYLLVHERLSELCVEALCKMEQINYSYQVTVKHPGIYLLMVHPNEVIRRWAILTARNLGKVDRDDYYDIQEVLTCLFKVIELGLFENPDIYTSMTQKGKLALLPRHLYDTSNYKNYWLGICMLLTVLEEQAMDSLLLGPDKQINFVQSIMSTMEKQTDGESNNPFWPALHCFMVMLDKLGSKVWGQPVDPVQAFQTIINSPSYKEEIKSIRQSCRRTKPEPLSDYGDDMITCSQIVYNYHTEKPQKDVGWKTAICPDYCPNMYEDMQTLADMLQYDVGRDMRLHNSTFLWFIPFVHSVMDLKEGVAYTGEVIHHLCSEIKEVFSDSIEYHNKVSEFFIRILVSVVELHHNKSCLYLLWVTSQKWVEAVVRCAMLPSSVFARSAERSPRTGPRVPMLSPGSDSVQSACMKLIRSLLKEGYQLGQKPVCELFLNKLNLFVRSGKGYHEGWQLSPRETQELQASLKQVVRSLKDRWLHLPSHEENAVCLTRPTLCTKQEKGVQEDQSPASTCYEQCLPRSSPLQKDEVDPESPLPRSGPSSGKVCRETPRKDQSRHRTSNWLLTNIKQEAEENSAQEGDNLGCSKLANGHEDAQENGICLQRCENQNKCVSSHKSSHDRGFPTLKAKETSGKEERLGGSEKNHDATNGGGTAEAHVGQDFVAKKIKSEKSDWTSKLKQLVANTKRSNSVPPPAAANQQPLVGASGGQEGRKGRNAAASHGASNALLCEREASATTAVQVSLLSIKRELKDGLAEPKSTPKVEHSLEESSSDEELDNVPLLKIRQELVKKRSVASGSSMTDSQVDRDLSKLSLATYSKVINFPVDSSQESAVCQKSHIKRKVQGMARSWSGSQSNESSSDADGPPNGVIVISDCSSDDDEDGERKEEKPDARLEKQPCCVPESVQEHKLPAAPGSPLLDEECASQCFEFETQDDIYSAWEDSQVDAKAPEAPDPPAEASSCSALARELEVVRQINDWGYETDYLGDDAAEAAAEALEQQVQRFKREKRQAEKSQDVKAKVKMRASTHRSPGRPGQKGSVTSQLAKPANKSPRPSTHSKKWPQARHVRTAPAVIPPKKVHHCPPPKSTAEKLFLKKAPRKAFELSQRSLDSVAELRTYGKAAGELALPQTKKSKLIPAQALVGKNRKLLACQDLQFLRQSRPRAREKAPGGSPQVAKVAKAAGAKQCVQQPASRGVAEGQRGGAEHADGSCSSKRKQLQQRLLEREEAQPPLPLPQAVEPPSNKKSPLARQGSTGSDVDVQESTSALPASLGTSCPVSEGSRKDPVAPPAPSSGLCSEEAAPRDNKSSLNKNVEEDDSLFLTQMDTLDMELCSQMEDVSCPIEVDPLSAGRCQHSGCAERVGGAGLYCRKHAARDPADHAFVKPPAPAKLSTTKIFSSSSSSRSAQLTKELGNVSKPPMAPKSKLSPAHPPASKANGFKPQTPTFSSIFRPQNENNIAPSRYTQSSHAGGISRILPAPGVQARQERCQSLPQVHGLIAQPRDHRIFIREVLRWSYDMFENFSQLGPPDNLFQSIVGPVPVRFQDYSDYFNTFFHLMMLNAFETVAQEWLETRKSKEQKPFLLNLLNFTADLNKADFTGSVSESDLASQLHPKEDDLVFLIVSEKRRPCAEESEAESRLVPHIGLVTRFSHPSVHDTQKKEQQVTCHLSVQTQGNLSRVSSQVKCVVVSSLVTTQRKFRALLLLNRNPLCKAIINPSYTDFCPRGLNVEPESSASYVKDFNEDQRRAIETAYTMVTEHPSLPRICLIHGPPGTGKSKAILGLLCRILNEKSGMENPVQSLNAKVKRNRVLVCAPSNAAVDELMKKIILEFKEKCQDKANPLGNCGDINLVRLGQEKSISKDILKFSLNDQVNHRMGRAILSRDPDPHMGREDLCVSTEDLHKRKEELDRRLDMLSRQRAMDRSENREKRQQLEDDICRLSMERERLTSKLKKARGQSQELKTTIILESHIICCTLSTSGGVLLESAFRRQGYDPFSCIVVDEAGQACEVEALIPLIHGCKKLVLVGDPKQLPPTVKSMKAQVCGYDQSLMSRLCVYLEEQVQENLIGRSPVLKLTTQYRMHPDLCLFPSNYIYGGSLKTSRQTETSRSGCNWPFQPYLLFDVQDGEEERDSDSFANPQEVKLVIELMKLIKQEKRDLGHRHIGIITPYSAQKRRILKQLDKEFGATRAGEVDTVDGFQGREKDCIIVTCVRANSAQGSIGFLRSLQRLNVTITRAKYSLFILGRLATLMDNKDWNELIQDAQKRGAIIKTSSNSYKHDATKILKPLRGAAVQPERVPRGQTSTAGSKQKEAPRRDTCPAAASTGAPAQRNTAVRPSLPPPDSSRILSLPTQATSVRERPQDPRLARRVNSATTSQGTVCKEAGLSASSGPGGVLLQSPSAPPPGQWNRSNTARPPSSRTETSSRPVAGMHGQGAPLAPALPNPQNHDRNIPAAAGEAKTLGQQTHPSPTERRNDKDYRLLGRRTSQQPPERSPADAKRRRTTY